MPVNQTSGDRHAASIAGFASAPSRRAVLMMGAAAGGMIVLDPFRRALAEGAGGTFTIVVGNQPSALIQIVLTGATSTTNKTNEGLIVYSPDGAAHGALATSWDVSDDALTYTFHLREGVKWHDGQPFTSLDVARSFELLKAFNSRGRSSFANLDAVETPDEVTAVFRLGKPIPFLLKALSGSESPIVPAHLYPAGEDPGPNPNNKAPIGTGPFIFREWVQGSHVIYDRNPDYWDAPKPYVDRLVIRFIKEPGASVAALESGEAQAVDNAPVADIARLLADPRFAATYAGLSQQNIMIKMEFNLGNKEVGDIRVRRAIAQAIDRQALIDIVWAGFGKPADSPIPSTSEYHVSVETEAFDPDAANAALDAAGYPRGADGNRFRLALVYSTSLPTAAVQADFIKQSLAVVGIDVEIKSGDFATYLARVYTDREFDINVTTLSALYDPTVGVQRIYWSKNIKPGVSLSNGSHYTNARVDELLEAAAVEADPDKRAALFKEFQEIVAADMPTLDLLEVGSPSAIHDKNVTGFDASADGLWGSFAEISIAG
jgi:peptide/nickel transport system substrate-binding protein